MIKTKMVNRIFKGFALFFCIFCSLTHFSPAEATNAFIRFDGRKMSADIDGVLLGEVFEEIEAQRKFSVKGDRSILNSEISVSFANRSFQYGLKKILRQINHILLFDKNREPSGVIIVDSGGFLISTEKARPDKKKVKVVSNDKKNIDPTGTGNKLHGPTPASDMTPPTEEELVSMEVIKDAPTPGGPVKVTEQEMENFKIIKNSTPPGGVVKVTPEELESINPISDDS